VTHVVPDAVHPGQFAETPEQVSDMTSMQHGSLTPPQDPQLPA
jgi:hypothetical protein